MFTGRLLLAVAAFSLLVSCNPLSELGPTQRELVDQGWFPPQSQTQLTVTHCYRTLAEVDCSTAPVAGAERRKVGFFDAPVAD